MVYIKNLKISKNVYFSIIYFITSKLGCCHGYFKDIIKSWYLTYLWKINIQYLDFHNAVNQSWVTHIADMWETDHFVLEEEKHPFLYSVPNVQQHETVCICQLSFFLNFFKMLFVHLHMKFFVFIDSVWYFYDTYIFCVCRPDALKDLSLYMYFFHHYYSALSISTALCNLFILSP